MDYVLQGGSGERAWTDIINFIAENAPEDFATWAHDVRRTMSMGAFRKFRSREIVEAKEMDHGGAFHNPQTGQRENFRAGDMLVRDGAGKQRIVGQEAFVREWEPVE